jgi:hypothetical protein
VLRRRKAETRMASKSKLGRTCGSVRAVPLPVELKTSRDTKKSLCSLSMDEAYLKSNAPIADIARFFSSHFREAAN